MNSKLSCAIVLLIALTLLATYANASNSRPPRNNDISNMADALKYLQDLDAYYGDRARVRFGKRMPWAQILHNRMPENADMIHTPDFPAGDEPF